MLPLPPCMRSLTFAFLFCLAPVLALPPPLAERHLLSRAPTSYSLGLGLRRVSAEVGPETFAIRHGYPPDDDALVDDDEEEEEDDASAVVRVENRNVNFWVADIQVGASTLPMVLDSASHEVLTEVGAYVPSPASRDLGFRTDLGFISGVEFSAEVFEDVVGFALASDFSVTAPGITISSIVDQPPGRIVPPSLGYGVLGLSFSYPLAGQPPSVKVKGLLQGLYESRGIRGYRVDFDAEGGTLTLLENSDAADPGMAYVDVQHVEKTSGDDWYVPFSVAGMEPSIAYLDTGGGSRCTTSVSHTRALGRRLGPSVNVTKVYYGETNILGECGTPLDVRMRFGEVEVPIRQEMLWEEVGLGPHKGKCVLRIVGRKIHRRREQWILAEPFFRSAIVEFDYAKKRAGIKPK